MCQTSSLVSEWHTYALGCQGTNHGILVVIVALLHVAVLALRSPQGDQRSRAGVTGMGRAFKGTMKIVRWPPWSRSWFCRP